MNNDIKEMNFSEMLFNRDGRLLDYITNLQEENVNLKNRLENAVADCNLRLQENERLALELSGYRTAILNDDKLLGLQNRIDKAIEYIKENQYRLDLDRIKNELLEILGDDNE